MLNIVAEFDNFESLPQNNFLYSYCTADIFSGVALPCKVGACRSDKLWSWCLCSRVWRTAESHTWAETTEHNTNRHTHRHRNWVTITVTQSCDVASGSSARANKSRVFKTAASEKPPFQNTLHVAEPRERCEPKYLDLDAEGRSVCRLVEDRICQVGETQSAAAVDVHHLVTAPRWTKRNLSSFVCSARYFSSIQADWFVWLFVMTNHNASQPLLVDILDQKYSGWLLLATCMNIQRTKKKMRNSLLLACVRVPGLWCCTLIDSCLTNSSGSLTTSCTEEEVGELC